ncbi:hypothetical protein JW911_02340 [Candidatus Peregrinibacteria bacterium]|nr:hypothetical protein [Candidatus Peregrinibacteria bacterium]
MHSQTFKTRIYLMLDKHKDKVMDFYIKNGPYALRKKLNINDDNLWDIVFDYLVIEKEAVKYCVRVHSNYISGLYKSIGPAMLRQNFCIQDEKYNDIWEYVTDYIGISKGAIYDHISENKEKYNQLIYSGRASQIRKEFGLERNKYNQVWEEILDLLLECVSIENFNFGMFDHGLKMFSNFYNIGRKHRGLKCHFSAKS